MKNQFSLARARCIAVKTCVLVAAVSVASGAHAAGTLPTWASTMITDAGDQVTAVLTAIGAVIGISLAGFLVIKLVKRGVAKI